MNALELLPPICVLVGGRGTRLGALTDHIPKPMIRVAGKPFLEWVLTQLRDAGFRRAVLCTGYRGDMVQDYFGTGKSLGIAISYSDDGPTPLGTLGAVRKALPLLGDPVPVLYGDTYLQVDFAAGIGAHQRSGRKATMSVLRNKGEWDASNAIVLGDRVASYGKSPPPPSAEWIDYGFSVIDTHAIRESSEADLADFMSSAARSGNVSAFVATKRFYEIGTPRSLVETESFLTPS